MNTVRFRKKKKCFFKIISHFLVIISKQDRLVTVLKEYLIFSRFYLESCLSSRESVFDKRN